MMRIPKISKDQSDCIEPITQESLGQTMSVDEFMKSIEARLEARPWIIKRLSKYKMLHYSAAYYFKRPYLIPKDTWVCYSRKALYFWQRGRRGYSDRDLWNFDSYLTGVIVSGLNQFKENTHTYPAALTPEQWDEVLQEIIDGFNRNTKIRDQVAWPTLDDKEDWEKTMRLFGRWYNDLWD